MNFQIISTLRTINTKPEDFLLKQLCAVKGISNTAALKISSNVGIQRGFIMDHFSSSIEEQLSSLFIRTPFHVDVRYMELRTYNLSKVIARQDYRASRHLYALPVRGQRTKSNARTQKNKSSLKTNTLRTAFRRKIKQRVLKQSNQFKSMLDWEKKYKLDSRSSVQKRSTRRII